MEFVNGNASRMAYEYIQESISSFSPEELNKTLNKVIAAPALANAALLAANGCTTTFVTVVSSLYMANNMPIPDFSELQNISNFQMGHKGNKPTNCDDSKTKDLKISLETVDFSSINEELKIFNENFYTITDTSPPDWEEWFEEENNSLHPSKTRTLSSGISVSSLASTTSSADVPKINALGQYSHTSSNVSMINPGSNSLRHSSSSGISLTSFRSSSESLDGPNFTHSYKVPFSSTPLASDLKAALSPIKMALLHSLNPDWKRSSLSPKEALPQSKELNNLHRHILSSKMAESSNFKYSHCNRLLSPRKNLTPFSTPTDILRNIPSSKDPVSLIPLDLTKKVKTNSVTHDSFKTSSSMTYDSTKLTVPSTNHTEITSPSSYKSETFNFTTDSNTSPWVVVRSHDDIELDNNITTISRNETFEKSARKMWQRCRTQLF